LLAQQIVGRALEKDPDLRYQHATDFATDLRRVLRDLEPARGTGSEKRLLALDASAAPRGRRSLLRGVAIALGLVLLAGVAAIFLMPTPSTQILDSTQISTSNETKLGPLATDGSRLYFESNNIPSAMSVSGGIIASIPGLSSGMYMADVSPDGSKVLAWAADMNSERNIGWLLVGSSLGGPWRRIGTGKAKQNARWSADGKSIYFLEERQVWIMDQDGSHAQMLWQPPHYPWDLAVSPDGRQVAVTVVSDVSRIWLMDRDGKNPHLLDLNWPAEANQYAGQWTSEGRHFFFNSDREGRGNLYDLLERRWFEFWKKRIFLRTWEEPGGSFTTSAVAPQHYPDCLARVAIKFDGPPQSRTSRAYRRHVT
jgi:WD40-like Beta Propeller Repeat